MEGPAMTPQYFDATEGAERPRDWTGAVGTKIDLHCHSRYSVETLAFLPGMSWNPLLEPWEVYDLAKARGMDFVTITDHDRIDGCRALLDRRGDLPDFIIGEEVSVAFPEDGTVVHVNVYDHDEEQHREIQRLRGNLYELVGYLRGIGKLFVLNHLTWTEQHRALTTAQLERILELFPVFEGLNGARSYAHNAFVWRATAGRNKTLVGGSDSHTHRVGTTYTLSAGETKAELLANIQRGYAVPCGAFGTPEKLRDDVWAVFHATVERRIAAATSYWERLACRTFRKIVAALHPLACRGYHRHQDTLIREFAAALPT